MLTTGISIISANFPYEYYKTFIFNENDDLPRKSCSRPQASIKVEHWKTMPSSIRFRRSNDKSDSIGEKITSAVTTSTNIRDRAVNEPYETSEEFFLPQASHRFPINYDKSDLCVKVFRDSMVCTVCEDPKTSGKYEQCSYIAKPNEEAYAYTKSSSSGKPTKTNKSSSHKKRNYNKPASTYESIGSSEYRDDELSEYNPKQVFKEATGFSECKQVQHDSQVCIVCKDPKTGGNSERCSYTYKPDDKVYKFTRSKSFEYPETSDKNTKFEIDDGNKEVPELDSDDMANYSDTSRHDSFSSYQKPKGSSGYQDADSPSPFKSNEGKVTQTAYDYIPTSPEYIESESKETLNDASLANCKRVQRDTMTCTICKDSKTGENSESCTYSYQPNDKKFAYTKSKSFRSPTGSQNTNSDYSSEESNPFGLTEYSDERYGYASENKPLVDYQNRKQKVTTDLKTQGILFSEGTSQAPVSKANLEFLGTSKRQAEIEKFLNEFQAEDRSQCRKVMRSKMTCYQCKGESGFQKEECMFITTPEKKKQKTKNQISYRETKKFKLDPKPETTAFTDYMGKNEPIEDRRPPSLPLEPAVAASVNFFISKKKPEKKKNNVSDNNFADNEDDNDKNNSEIFVHQNKHNHHHDDDNEAEPYEYVSETEYKYDKVLGLTLPVYMLKTSDYEKEFDDIYTANSSS